jgi:cystathionine gamma-synthase
MSLHAPASATRAVRAGIATDLHHGAVVPPIHLTATFSFQGFDQKRIHDYTRTSNPTRDHLAEALAELEEGKGAVVTSTGMSAVLLALQLVPPGGLVVAPHDCYGGTQRLLNALAQRDLFDVSFRNLTVDQPLKDLPRSPTLVWIETPSNPLLRITNIRALAEQSHALGALVVADNTFLSPALQRPLVLGADIVVHSTTKYLNGHSDVVGGGVIAADEAVVQHLEWWANCLGITGAPFDSFLTLRGIRTLFPRMAMHVQNAHAVVDALCAHEAVEHVYYPGLSSHPGHEIAAQQQSAFGAMVSFELRGGVDAVRCFVESLHCFTLAESLGGVESLVAHPPTMTHAAMTPEARAAAGIGDHLVRLSVGIEFGPDLVHDLRHALDRVQQSQRGATPLLAQREAV